MPARDERWLQQRHRTWYAVQEIPKNLRHAFLSKSGKSLVRLIRSLKTDNYEIAKARRHRVLVEWQQQFEAARVPQAYKDNITAALEWRDYLKSQSNWPDDEIVARWDIETSAGAIADPESRETFLSVAIGRQTPPEPFIETWLGEQDIEQTSNAGHRRSLKELLEWCSREQIPPTVQGLTGRVAGQYVSHLLNQGLHRSKTVSKRLRPPSRFGRGLSRKAMPTTTFGTGMR